MVEAMAAANAFLRLKTEDKSLSVSIIYVQLIKLLCDYPGKMHTWHPKEQRLHCKKILWGSSNK